MRRWCGIPRCSSSRGPLLAGLRPGACRWLAGCHLNLARSGRAGVHLRARRSCVSWSRRFRASLGRGRRRSPGVVRCRCCGCWGGLAVSYGVGCLANFDAGAAGVRLAFAGEGARLDPYVPVRGLELRVPSACCFFTLSCCEPAVRVGIGSCCMWQVGLSPALLLLILVFVGRRSVISTSRESASSEAGRRLLPDMPAPGHGMPCAMVLCLPSPAPFCMA